LPLAGAALGLAAGAAFLAGEVAFFTVAVAVAIFLEV
jgi:hypothetical protein